MITITVLVILVHVVLFRSGVNCRSFSNVEMFAIIRNNAEIFSAGDYSIKNVATNKYLTFKREDRVGVVLQEEYATVRMEQDGQYGSSGLTQGYWFGTVLSGCGMCGSSQYGYPEGKGKIIAMAAYSCRAGEPGKGNKTPIPIAKQFYHLVKCSDKWNANGIIENPIELGGQETQKGPTRHRSLNDGLAKPQARHRRDATTRRRHRRTRCGNASQDGTQDIIIGKQRLEQPNPEKACHMIIGEDHLLDQKSRALRSTQMKTYNTFVDVAMADLDGSDPTQQWIVERAREGSPSPDEQCSPRGHH